MRSLLYISFIVFSFSLHSRENTQNDLIEGHKQLTTYHDLSSDEKLALKENYPLLKKSLKSIFDMLNETRGTTCSSKKSFDFGEVSYECELIFFPDCSKSAIDNEWNVHHSLTIHDVIFQGNDLYDFIKFGYVDEKNTPKIQRLVELGIENLIKQIDISSKTPSMSESGG